MEDQIAATFGPLFPVLPGAKGANKQSSHCMQMQLCEQLYVCLSVLALQYCLSLLTHDLPQKHSRKAITEITWYHCRLHLAIRMTFKEAMHMKIH